MKEELHQRLWSAQERWLELRGRGLSKRDLKLAGLRERGDPAWGMRHVIFTGNTRVTYERVLKRFVTWCHALGVAANAAIDKRHMRDYVREQMASGASQSTLDKVRSACVKFGALYGKFESFHATSERLGREIRELVADGLIAGPKHQRITAEVATRALDRLRELDARHLAETGTPRAYALAAELQRECGLRAIEATERLTPDLLVVDQVLVDGKGGRPRSMPVPPALTLRLRDYFAASKAMHLAPLRAYETAWRRAVLEVGGRSTGTHALRRLFADDLKNQRYRELLAAGVEPGAAWKRAVSDTLEALGHGRERWELATAYLRGVA